MRDLGHLDRRPRRRDRGRDRRRPPLIGARDESDETVTAGEWAQSVVRRGRRLARRARGDRRGHPDPERIGARAPRSRSRRRRRDGPGFVRAGLERAVRRPRRWSRGSRTPAFPTRPQGEEAARLVSDWAELRAGRSRGRRRTRSTRRRTRSRSRSSNWPTPPGAIGAGLAGGVADARRGGASSTPSSRRRCASRARVSRCGRRPAAMSTTDWILARGSGPRRHRLHRPRRPLGRDRPRALGRRRDARPRLRLRARSRRAADQRDPDHHRGHLGGGGDAGRGRRRLHGQDREQGSARAVRRP